jgi:hypothetical protein
VAAWQRLAAGVAIDATPIKGVLPLPISPLRASFPALRNPGNLDAAVSLTPEQDQYAFGNTLTWIKDKGF